MTKESASDYFWQPIVETAGRIEIHKHSGRLRLGAKPVISLPRHVHLYLIRHGETRANRMQIFQGSDQETEWTQLSEKGHLQSRVAAEALMARIQSAHPGIGVWIASSPAARARQTAEYFIKSAGHLAPRFEILSCLNEIKFGDMTGKTLEEICALSPEHARFIHEYRMQGNAFVAAGGSENFLQVLARVCGGFSEWVQGISNDEKPKNLVVFTHMITAGAVRAALGDRTLLEADGATGSFLRWRQVLQNAVPLVWNHARSEFEVLPLRSDAA